MGRGLGVGVVADLVGEGLDGEVGGVRGGEPALGLGATHDLGLLERIDDVVREEVVLGAGVDPSLAVDVLEGGAKGLGAAAVVDELLQAGELEVLAVEAEGVVEHAGEGALEDVLVLLAHGLVVHVEEDGLGGYLGAALGLGPDHGVGELAVEVVEGAASADLAVGEQVREHLEEMRLTGAKEAADPDADLVCRDVESALVGAVERGEVARELAGDDVLGEFLLDGGIVFLGDLDHAVDVAVDVALEHLLDTHGVPFPPRNRSDCPSCG